MRRWSSLKIPSLSILRPLKRLIPAINTFRKMESEDSQSRCYERPWLMSARLHQRENYVWTFLAPPNADCHLIYFSRIWYNYRKDFYIFLTLCIFITIKNILQECMIQLISIYFLAMFYARWQMSIIYKLNYFNTFLLIFINNKLTGRTIRLKRNKRDDGKSICATEKYSSRILLEDSRAGTY